MPSSEKVYFKPLFCILVVETLEEVPIVVEIL